MILYIVWLRKLIMLVSSTPPAEIPTTRFIDPVIHVYILYWRSRFFFFTSLQRGTKTFKRRKPLQRGRGPGDRHRAARDTTVAELRTAWAHRSDALASQVERRSDPTAAVLRHRRPRSADALVVHPALQRQAQHGFPDRLVGRGT